MRRGACFQRSLWYNKHIAKYVNTPEIVIPSMVNFETSYVVPEYLSPQTDEMNVDEVVNISHTTTK